MTTRRRKIITLEYDTKVRNTFKIINTKTYVFVAFVVVGALYDYQDVVAPLAFVVVLTTEQHARDLS